MGKKEYVCPECGHYFGHAFNNWVHHLKTHHGYRICAKCKEPFKPKKNETMCPNHKAVTPFQKLMQQRIKAGKKFHIS